MDGSCKSFELAQSGRCYFPTPRYKQRLAGKALEELAGHGFVRAAQQKRPMIYPTDQAAPRYAGCPAVGTTIAIAVDPFKDPFPG